MKESSVNVGSMILRPSALVSKAAIPLLVATFAAVACGPAPNKNVFEPPWSKVEATTLKGYQSTLSCYGQIGARVSDARVIATVQSTQSVAGPNSVLTFERLTSENGYAIQREVLHMAAVDSIELQKLDDSGATVQVYKSGSTQLNFDPVLNRAVVALSATTPPQVFRIDCKSRIASQF